VLKGVVKELGVTQNAQTKQNVAPDMALNKGAHT